MSIKHFFALLLLTCATAAAQIPYKFVNEIPIGGEGGWDILNIDAGAHRLYLSHATKVVVVDLTKNAVVGEINATPGVHAFFPVPQFNHGFSSNEKENKCSVVELDSLKTISKFDTDEGPDAIAYAPHHRTVFIFNHQGGTATATDAATLSPTGRIPLGGHPEFAVSDDAAGRVYVNIEDKSEVAVIDTADWGKRGVVARWPLAPGEEPTGIALDAAHHRLFAACHNKMLVMLDTDSGKVVANVAIGAGTDGCAFDDATQLVFASCGEGVVTIAHEDSPNKLSILQTLTTERGARTMALDPQTHRIYLPSAQFNPARTPGARPTIVPNTLKLLVYGPAEK
jgi:DNA-binding beta-propeller fold protein YncE